MLSTRCKLLGGALGLALLLAGSSPASAQQAILTPPGQPSGDGTNVSSCWPWCNEAEALSNQVLNSQDVSQTQDTQPDGNGSDGGKDCGLGIW